MALILGDAMVREGSTFPGELPQLLHVRVVLSRQLAESQSYILK